LNLSIAMPATEPATQFFRKHAPAVPCISEADRQRGWAEYEIELLDGTRQFVRVHAIELSDFHAMQNLPLAEAVLAAMAKSLRIDQNFAARIRIEDHYAITAMLVSLVFGDAGGTSIMNCAHQLAEGIQATKPAE
jgi:hypothetical protein